jgi:hypothetical protein
MVEGRSEPKYVAPKNNRWHDRKKLKKYATELGRLDERFGGVTPQQLVDAAREPDSVFHGEFEWNKKKAATRFWLWQARNLIGWIRVEVQITGMKGPRAIAVAPRIARAFPSVPGDDGRTYMARPRALRDPAYQAELLKECLAELARLLGRMMDVPKLRVLRLAIEAALATFRRKATKKTG